MENQCIYDIIISTNEAGLKKINKLSRKLNTTETKLLASILSHGINAMVDCLDTKDPFKNAKPVYTADIQKHKSLAPTVNPKKDREESDTTGVPGLEGFKF